MNTIIIRQEEEKDYKRVFEVVKSAFENAEHTDHDEHFLVERLRNSDAFIPELSLVAEIKDEVVGHILFTKIMINGKMALALAPVSVCPNYQGLGIGKALIEKGHEIAKQLGFMGVVLLGHPAYYPKFGYTKASTYGIKAPFDVPDEAFMAKELQVNGFANYQGIVEYAKEFFINS